MERRPELLSSVMLRQNPHAVHEWHKRVKLFEGNPTRQILTYTEAVKTVDADKVRAQGNTAATGPQHLYRGSCALLLWTRWWLCSSLDVSHTALCARQSSAPCALYQMLPAWLLVSDSGSACWSPYLVTES